MEQEQFKQEVLPLREQLSFYAQRLLGDLEDAEDIIQEVFLKLWYMRYDLVHYNSVAALSMQMTKHLCLNRLKAKQRRPEKIDELSLKHEIETPHTRLEEKDDVEDVMRIINRLPDLQKTILRMRHIDGFEVEEIAALTGSNPEAVRMNLSRARKKVRDQFIKMQV